MSYEALQQRSDGALVVYEGGIVAFNDASEEQDCCECQSECVIGIGVSSLLRDWPSPFPALPFGHNRSECKWIAVWSHRTVTGNTVGGAQEPDFILKTRGFAAYPGGLPYETTKGSGIYLDEEPYWWAGCNVGGWELVDQSDVGYELTLAEVEALRVPHLSHLFDGEYTILAQVTGRSYHEVPSGTPIVPKEDGKVNLDGFRYLKY
jgi:hypothetical protein